MAFSIQRAVSDGNMTLLPISIEYFDREEISVLFDGVQNARQWAWVGTTDKTLSFTPAVANTVEVTVIRSTDLAALRHQFSQGAQFTAESLDEALLQVLHIAQEARENTAGISDVFSDLNMHGNRVVNIAAGTASGHAVEFDQMNAAIAATNGEAAVAAAAQSAASAASAAAHAASAVTASNAANTAAALGNAYAAAAAGSAGLAANYATLSAITDYGSIVDGASVISDYGSI